MTMEDSEAIESLREILAKSSPKTPAHSPLHQKSITPVASEPASPVLYSIRPKPLALEYPSVNVPGSSPKSTPLATPPRSPRSVFGTTIFRRPKSAPGTTPSRSRSNSFGGGLFSSLWGRKSWAHGKDGIDGGKYTTRTPKYGRSLSYSSLPYSAITSSPNVLSGLASTFHFGSPSKNAGRGALMRAGGSSPDMPSSQPFAKHKRTISWVDQPPIRPARSPSLSSKVDLGGAQIMHGSEIAPLFVSQEDSDSEPSSSTLSLNSPFSSDLSLAVQPPIADQRSNTTTMSASLRDLSPFKGKPLWEPDDEEWAEMDATRICSTYKASFKDPGQYSPPKTTNSSTLSRLSNTITLFLPSSPKKLAEEARLREEEDLRDNLEELENTYYSDPAGDLHDAVMSSVFLAASRYFPLDQAGRSTRIPHVVDLEQYFNTQDALVGAAYPRLGDAIATILSHTDRNCVEAFLDPRVEEFVYRREVDRSAAGNVLVVRRMGNRILAGSYRNLGFSLSWTLYVRASFSATGLWYDTYASPVAGSSPIVNGVPAWDVFIPVDDNNSSNLSPPPPRPLPASMQSTTEPKKIELASLQQEPVEDEECNERYAPLSPTSERFALYQSRRLARFLLRDVWVRLEGRYECKASCEVDGVMREVRLKMAVVGFAADDEDEE